MIGDYDRASKRPASPRRVRNGLKLRAAGEPEPATWVSSRLLGLLGELVPEAARKEGLDYARRGQTRWLEIGEGRVQALVQGRAAAAYRILWDLDPLTEEQGERILQAMAGEAIYAAKLLAGELPPAVEGLFGAIGLHLVPPASQVAVTCECSVGGRCKHVAAVGYLLAERLEDDPLGIFVLRGIPRVLDRLASARLKRTRGVAAAHADQLLGVSVDRPPPLEQTLDGFWRSGPQLGRIKQMPPPRHAPHALLRRLGPSPLKGKFPLVGLLASIYDTVARSAIRLRDNAERLAGGEKPPPV